MGKVKKFYRSEKNRKERVYNLWFDRLLLVVANIFKCDNLPPNLPLWQIESRLILWGYCCVFKNKVYGVITSNCSLSGWDIYDMPNKFRYSQSILGSSPHSLLNLTDGVIGWGTSVDKMFYNGQGHLRKLISYYADILSDVDLSRRIYLINGRATASVTAKSDNALTALKEFYRQLENGELYVPKIESGVLDSTEDILKDISRSGSISLNDFDVCMQNILKMFYADLGISYAMEKRERMITDEVTAEQDALSANVRDMLLCRQEFAQQCNSTFGTDLIYGVNNDVIT